MPNRFVRFSLSVRLFVAVACLPLSVLWADEGELLMQLSRSGYDDELVAGQLQPMGSAVYFIAESSGRAIGLWKADTRTTNTTLIKDLGTKKLVLRGPFELNGLLLFVVSGPGVNAGDPRRYELWRSDGSAGGTTMLKALGQEFGTATELIAKTSSLLFFNAAGLWRTDGTAAGTIRVTGGGGARLSRFGDQILFTTYDPAKGELHWITDGTIARTRLVGDINPSSANNRFSDDGFVEVGGAAFFGADDGVNGMQLWKTDGTEAGTVMVKKLAPLVPKNMVAFNGLCFFFRDRELWRSDGTEPGTVLVSKPHPEAPSAQLGVPQVVGPHLWFGVFADGRNELWRSDGTSMGTGSLALLADTSHYARLGIPGVAAQDFVAFQGQVYFRGYHEVLGSELWRTDGTPAGTQIAADINPGTMDFSPEPVSSNPDRFVVLNDKLFMIGDLPRTSSQFGARPRGVWRVGMPGPDGPLPSTNGVRMVKDINPIGHGVYDSQEIGGWENTDEFQDNRLFAFESRVYFFGRDLEHGLELWSSDGTEEGTRMVKDINSGLGSINLQTTSETSFMEHQGHLYFCVRSIFPGSDDDPLGIWRTDGTDSGTVRVWAGLVNEWAEYGGFVFVSGVQNGHNGLWRIGATSEEIVAVQLRGVDALPESPLFLAGFQGHLFFASHDRRKLWRTDSTLASAAEVKDFRTEAPAPGAISPSVVRIVPTGEACFLVIDGTTLGMELWKTDGTEAGTVLVKDINSGVADALDSRRQQFAELGGQLFFGAKSGNTLGLWTSDGTEEGTRPVHLGTDKIQSMRAINDRLYFGAGDRSVGTGELWTSDGTESGTFMLANINPDQWPVFSWGSSPQYFEHAGGLVYFAAGDNRYGKELWKTDGTPEGTVRVTDLNPIPAPALPPPGSQSFRGSSYPTSLTVAGSNLFFTADNGTFGRELWVLPLIDAPPPTLEGSVTPSGGFRVRITANPGTNYQLLRALDLAGAWVQIASGMIPDSGVAEVDDNNPPQIAAFYRVQTPGR